MIHISYSNYPLKSLEVNLQIPSKDLLGYPDDFSEKIKIVNNNC